jgi:hypothetical protein
MTHVLKTKNDTLYTLDHPAKWIINLMTQGRGRMFIRAKFLRWLESSSAGQ